MDLLSAAISNLTNPAVLAFVVGVLATLKGADLRLPDPVVTAITTYLLLGIGIKGGAALRASSLSDVWAPALGTLVLGVVTPLIAFAAMDRLGRFNRTDAAALAAHYGSVSMVTFAAAVAFMDRMDVATEGFLPTLVALLEVPGILVALVLARSASASTATAGIGAGLGAADRGLAGSVGAAANPAYAGGGGGVDLRGALRHAVGERSILLLVGGLAIGAIGGARGLEQVKPFFVDLFPGVLTLFLLQMGTLAGRHLADLRDVGARLVGLAVAVPLVNGVLGAMVGRAAGLSLGGATVLACMAASASYIAAPAAVRLALPDANPGYYLTAAIGVTFPFNVAIGIPLYHGVAQLLY